MEHVMLTWTSHVLVPMKNGLTRIRDEYYHEIARVDDLKLKIERRLVKLVGKGNALIAKELSHFDGVIQSCKISDRNVAHTIHKSDRPVFTYDVRPLKMAFELSGAGYKIDPDGTIKHVTGKRPFFKSDDGVKVHFGIPSEDLPSTPPFSTIDDKKVYGDIENHPLADPDGEAMTGSPIEPPKRSATSLEYCGPAPAPAKVKTKEWSKAVRTECQKYGIDPDLPPTNKPNGMRKKIWKQIDRTKK